jgi:hypothetical protein
MTTDHSTSLARDGAPAPCVFVTDAGNPYPAAGRSFGGNRGLESTVAA